MNKTGWALGALGLLVGAGVVIACGAGNADGGSYGKSGTGAQAGEGGSGEGGSGNGPSGGAGGNIPFDAPVMDVSGNDGFIDENCSAQSASGEVWPLDMYIMMDQSGSMSSPFGFNFTKTKWVAVTEGLATFFNNQPPTADLGVGIQFFPLFVKPWNTFTACPKGDECSSSEVCVSSGNNKNCYTGCTTPANCPGGDECYYDSQSQAGFCTNDVCDPAAYAKPEVPIDILANSKAAVIAAMKAHEPNNLTPTGVAIEGALTYAKAHAAAHLDRRVIVVLATDGEPTDCPLKDQPNAGNNKAKQLAQQALTGNPSVKTFVIGTIDPGNFIAVNSCKAIATAGGTEALILQQNQPLPQQFSDALDKIKGKAVGCEFKVPNEASIDTNKVNVVYTVDGGSEQFIYAVNSVADCDPLDGGWYYDNPAAPTAIKLCPASCAAVQQTGKKIGVSIQMGCVTQYMPPK